MTEAVLPRQGCRGNGKCRRAVLRPRFSWGSRRARRTRKLRHFRWKQPQFLQSRRDFEEDISRFLSEHFSALTGCACRLRTICAKTSQTAKTVITRDEKGVSGVLHFAVSAPRPRFGTLPCVWTAAEKVLPVNCSLRILRQRTVQKSGMGAGPAMLLPRHFTNNTAIGPTDGLPPCCNIIKGEIDHERKNYQKF